MAKKAKTGGQKTGHPTVDKALSGTHKAAAKSHRPRSPGKKLPRSGRSSHY